MKLGKGEAAFLLCYFLSIVSMFVFGDIYNKPRVLWAIFAVVTICVLITIFFELKTSRWNLVVRLIIIVLFSAAACLSRKPQMMVYAALMCASDLTSFERIVKTCFYTCGLMILLTFAADLAGIVPERFFSRGGGVIAHSFGFGYYNVVPFTFLFMVLEFFYLKSLRRKKASWIELAVIFGVNYFLFKMSTLRLSYYLVVGVLCLYIVLVKFDLIRLSRRWVKALSVLLYPVLFGVTLWINYIYTDSNEFLVKLNKLLTKRLELGNLALERYPVNLFGHYIETINTQTEYFYVDSGFLYSLLGYGLLFTGMALLLYIYLCRYASSENNKILFIWLVTVAAFSMINNTWISLYINPILLYAPILLGKKETRPIQTGTA